MAVLAGAFNHMLDRLTAAFASQRDFVADASHELRTPLTVIRGQLEVLAEGETPPAEEVRRVERLLLGEVTRVDRLVDDLLLLAQVEQSEFLQTEELDVPPSSRSSGRRRRCWPTAVSNSARCPRGCCPPTPTAWLRRSATC